MTKDKIKGRGAQRKQHNRFDKNQLVQEHLEGLDEPIEIRQPTDYIEVFPKTLINKVLSPDLQFPYSMNPYQGCEHGCVYCYARNSHNYWGYGHGIDFEQKILVKKNAPQLLEKELQSKNWRAGMIMLSGNTDCYQPIEKKLEITRSLLQVLLKYKHPVGIISKNVLMKRDIDILRKLNELSLLRISLSITTLNEKLRQVLEPRTASIHKKLKLIELLSGYNIPVNVMMAPIIPGLNSHEIFNVMKAVGNAGANSAAYTIVRLNGGLLPVFKKWLELHFPDRATKVIHQIKQLHNGSVNDSRWKKRMKGDGQLSQIISQQFHLAKKQFLQKRDFPPINYELFNTSDQLRLF